MRKATPTSSKMKSLVGQSEKPTTSSSASVEEHLGIDGPIQPSTSTFTLSGKDDKSEKLKKKARNFLDERQKIKPRTQSLWSLIGNKKKKRKLILFFYIYFFFVY